jgi:hypothetical protein
VTAFEEQKMRDGAVRALVVGAACLGLAACFETLASGDGPSAGLPKQAPAKVAATGKAKGSEKADRNVGERLRRRLADQCLAEEGGMLTAPPKSAERCACYADTLMKHMRPDDLAFFNDYHVIPTVAAASPDSVRKRCGLGPAPKAVPKAKLAPPEGSR